MNFEDPPVAGAHLISTQRHSGERGCRTRPSCRDELLEQVARA